MIASAALPAAQWLGMEPEDLIELLRSAFQLLALIGFLMLICYGWMTCTWRARIALMLLPAAFFYLKTLGEMGRHSVYEVDRMFNVVGGAPLAIVVGWLYAFWCSFHMARIVVRRIRAEEHFFMVVFLSTTVFSAFSYCVEGMGTAIGWWSWDVQLEIISGRPLYAVMGWASWGIHLYVFFCGLCARRWWHGLPFSALAVVSQQLHSRLLPGEDPGVFFVVVLGQFLLLAALAPLRIIPLRTTGVEVTFPAAARSDGT